MCGILGIVSDNSHSLIENSNSMISHRGPDDKGYYRDKGIALAHQRLAIIDLSEKGHQPMFFEDLVIIFNGEIYNHLEIRNTILAGNKFISDSDTETILQGFKKFGTDIFSKLNGIFSIAIFNKRTRELVLARDQFGIKPLYYYMKDDLFFFGSEIKSFLPIPHWDKSIDHTALLNYIHFLYSPGGQTPFKYINKFPSGHFIKIDIDHLPQNLKPEKYYEIPFDGSIDQMTEHEGINLLDKALGKAVERQLLSDVPIGFFLSGGLDSSILVAKAKEYTDKRIQCFTIDADFDQNDKEGFANDLDYAKKVAKHLDVDLEIVPADINIVRDFDKMIWHLDEPQADAAPLNVYNICKRAREMNQIVLIGGTAGDDLFSGYRRHQALNFEKYFKMIPSFIGKGIKNTISVLPSNNPIFRRANKLVSNADKTSIDRMLGYYEWLPYEKSMKLFNKNSSDIINGYLPDDILINSLKNIPNESNKLNQLLYWDMKYFLTDHNLNYTDKMSMAHGIEVRVPFLDVDLVALSTKLPVKLKMKGNTTKYLLKKVAEKYLPNDVIYRPKTGFGAPVRKWITNDLDEMIYDNLSPAKIKDRGIFDAKAVSDLIHENKTGKIDASYPIWALLAIESWFKQFID